METAMKICLRISFVLVWLSLVISNAYAEEHFHEFVIETKPVKRLCMTQNIVTVNGMFPGPTLEVRNGDTLVIKAINKAKYNITLHWHGIRQLRTAWADGPAYVTQCPIRPGESYTYRFTIIDQEGTLWWHAHLSWLRATVYGALIILPKQGSVYPFQTPHSEAPVILGEWWRINPLRVIRTALLTGGAPNVSDAFTINGQPGDLYPCSSQETTVIPVTAGQTILLRFINADMNQQLFVAIGGHTMTVVAADAAYTKPFTTSVMMIEPGQTTDVLVTANQSPGRYYIAAHAYASAGQNVAFDNTTTTAILQYTSASASAVQPVLPPLPAYNDTPTATSFVSSIKSLNKVDLPGPVDEELFFTVGLGVFNCRPGMVCNGPVNGTRFASSMNNISFVRPRTLSILEAHTQAVPGVFTDDFPPVPPLPFNFTANNVSQSLWPTVPGTKVFRLKYMSVVDLVLQGTNIVTAEDHPIHLHGHHFYVLARGFGNFNPKTDKARYNLVDPPQRNTVGVPVNGWAVIRFVADNPGVWLLHCHIDTHLVWGMAMVFITDNGLGELEMLEPRPIDLPICS